MPCCALGRRSQYNPLSVSHLSTALHVSPYCRAHMWQQPHPSITRGTPYSQFNCLCGQSQTLGHSLAICKINVDNLKPVSLYSEQTAKRDSKYGMERKYEKTKTESEAYVCSYSHLCVFWYSTWNLQGQHVCLHDTIIS